MGRRSPSNERYQKFTSPAGKTRKSAAAAKPKRAAGKSPGATSGSKGQPKTAKGRAAYAHPTTPEYKRMRMIWWVFLGGSVLMSIAAFFMWRQDTLKEAGNYVLAAAYGFIFVAIYLDWAKLRPMRQQWAKSGGATAAAEKSESSNAEDSSADTKS